jgi:hypothetical protein
MSPNGAPMTMTDTNTPLPGSRFHRIKTLQAEGTRPASRCSDRLASTCSGPNRGKAILPQDGITWTADPNDNPN